MKNHEVRVWKIYLLQIGTSCLY